MYIVFDTPVVCTKTLERSLNVIITERNREKRTEEQRNQEKRKTRHEKEKEKGKEERCEEKSGD